MNRLTGWFTSALTLLMICAVVPAPVGAEPVFEQGDCPVTFARSTDVRCGTVVIPQDRDNPAERVVRLAVAVFAATGADPSPDPLIFLDGGPGSRTLDSFAEGIGDFLRVINRNRDVILFDYRGIGYSDPSLTCEVSPDPADIDWISQCREGYEAQGVDVTNYTTRDNSADAADIVRALGYEAYNIWGGSYGSSVAMTLLRDHPEGIRAAIVTALQPPQGDLQAQNLEGLLRAVEGVEALCQADAGCASAYPGDLTEQLAMVVGRLEAEPVPLESGELNSIDLLVVLSELLKDEKNIPMIPGFIAAAYAQQYDAFVSYTDVARLPQDPAYPVGAWLSMRCTDSILATTSAAMDAALRLRDPAFSIPIMESHRAQVSWCEEWGARQPTEADRQQAQSAVPTLIISGALDPFSSQEWLESTLATLPNGTGMMLPYHMHYVTQNRCAAELLTSFIEDPRAELDMSCAEGVNPPSFSTR